jgi:Holliday junction resolvase RusA-like endonuclease
MIAFSVIGKPQPGGSKRAYPRRRSDGTLAVAVVDSNPMVDDWKALAQHAARQVVERMPTHPDGCVALQVDFYFERPKSHYRTGANAHLLRDGAPERPTSKPDATKVLRALEDALTGVVWRDDAQIVDQRARKFYGSPARAVVRVYGWGDELWPA